jgi:hypothetical protein
MGQIELDVQGTAEWKNCIRIEQFAIPRRQYYVGFTAATGDVAGAAHVHGGVGIARRTDTGSRSLTHSLTHIHTYT